MLEFRHEDIVAKIMLPSGEIAERIIQVRFSPITGRTCRVSFSRSADSDQGAERLPDPPPFADDNANCPFCGPRVTTLTPRFLPALSAEGRFVRGSSILFPNLFPYGQYSAVSLFDDRHFVEIGKADLQSYADSFLNCRDYLLQVGKTDPAAVFMGITQNHLPSAGGTMLHPHLQAQADRLPTNFQRFMHQRAQSYRERYGQWLFSDYLEHEAAAGERIIGASGAWQWMAAFAPEGFFDIWAILPGITCLAETKDEHWEGLARGVLNAQDYYRSRGRNGYNLGLMLLEDGSGVLELQVGMTVRANYTPWARSDFSGFEVKLGDMTTFTPPEEIAAQAAPFWSAD